MGLSSPLFVIGAGWLTIHSIVAVVTAIVTFIGARWRLAKMIKYGKDSANIKRIRRANRKINKVMT